MAQSAVVRDYRQMEIGRRRANRLVLTVARWGASPRLREPNAPRSPDLHDDLRLHHWHLPAGGCAPEPLDHPSSSFFQGPLEGGENLTVPVSTVHGKVQARPDKPVRLGAESPANPF